ncbi:glycine betaine transporter OpuD [Bacillus cytotoxicus]|uniref:Glycine betaine transporter n=1 Tax=Bacillus cytotoxicus TaxID=580165 RepID=A0AAX2CMW5_9BACI|nr:MULTISPECIES: BCCT family transporter [Bacillus cereus group]AWC34585.1 BCCT family transporter [Bacillus cytotoxicus]AWC38583.1 BCCT family transporter [Bacillus cytotoxicus]AWC62800.1 BCCT family transporter [Bacillus cytotoxicus]KMT49606.1 glycine/betaine ABC transporter permease [Bacillus cytotoxicus]QTR84134.1 BCCT family transporter [Bacillus cytotoxicus]
MRKLTKTFIVSLVLCLAFTIWGIIPESVIGKGSLGNVTTAIQHVLVSKFGWFYIISVSIFLGISIFLIVSKYGSIRLGKDDDEPDYSYLTWFAMLFSAGMGIGLIFWGVAEPLNHLYAPPYGESATEQSARLALRFSFFHWGLHPWGLYALVALCIAYFTFRKGKPSTISATVGSLFKSGEHGRVAHIFDVLAVFATVFGVATSLGLGAQQIAGGIGYLTPIPNSLTTQLVIIGAVTILFMLSAQTGLDKGIKYLSNTNIILAFALMVILLFAGPTNFIMNYFTSTIGAYIQELPSMSFRLSPLDKSGNQWIQSWTIFYWAWWIAWSPFVGTFIARVSRGRTIREFVIGVLLVPTLIGALWFSVFGGTGIYMELFDHANIYEQIKEMGTEIGLFAVFDHMGSIGPVLSVLAILLISTFFITSADSATFVLGMLTTHGSLNPPNRIKLIWGIVQAALAAILLYVGGLAALQTASIIAAFPFAFVIFFMVASLFKELQKEGRHRQRK